MNEYYRGRVSKGNAEKAIATIQLMETGTPDSGGPISETYRKELLERLRSRKIAR